MKRWIYVMVGVLMVGLVATPCFSFIKPGTKAMGMGGAFTAVADDISSVYWNPAGITKTGYFDLDISLAVGGENVEDLENLYNLYQAVEDKDYDAAEKIVGKINAPLGLAPTFTIGIGLFKRIALSGGLQADFSITKFTKVDNCIKIEDTETALVPIYLSFARKTTENLTLGLNAKYIQAARHQSNFNICEEDVYVEHEETARANAFSFDVGILYQRKDSPFTLGVMVEDLLEPELKFSEGLGSMTLSRKINIGIAYRPFPLLTLAADVHNLTDKSTLHIGGEVDLKLIKLRAGLNEGDLSLGVGLNFFLFNIQAAYYEKDKKDPYVSLVLFHM